MEHVFCSDLFLDHTDIMVLLIQCLQGDLINQLVMLSSVKHLAELWSGWPGRDPSTPPGPALD